MMKQDKIKKLCIANLTYCRLKADLAAVEMELVGNAPVAETEESNFLKKIWTKAKTVINNELRKKTSEELKKDKALIEAELARFESQHNAKELTLSSNPLKLKAFIAKTLFKEDKTGVMKVQFGISLLLDDRYTYQRPSQSLQILSDILFDDANYMQGLYDTLDKHFKYLHDDIALSLDELISFAPTLGNVSLQSIVNRHKQRKFTASLAKLSSDQVGALLAIKLTIAEKVKPLLPREDWENLVDETLQYVGDIRADAEYGKVFQVDQEETVEEIFSLCSRAVNRLAELVKA